MTRRKNHRRSRRKQDAQETLQQSPRDSSSFVANEAAADIENNILDSSVEMDPDTSNSNLRTPEALMYNSQNSIDPLHYKDLSPKIVGKIPKIKLDLDIPDCDVEPILETEPTKLDITLEKVKSEELSDEDNLPKLEIAEIESIDTKLDDYLLDKTVSMDSAMKSELEAERNKWSEEYYNTTDSLQRYVTPAMAFGSANKRLDSDDKLCYRHNFNHANEQSHSEHCVSKKNPSTASASQTDDSINTCFTFEGMRKQDYRVADETLVAKDVDWHGKNRTVSNSEQSRILKTVSEPETLRAKKYVTQKHSGTNMYDRFRKPQSTFSSDDNASYLTDRDVNNETNCSRSSSPPAKRSRTALRFENETQPRTISSIPHPSIANFLNQGRLSPIEDDSEYIQALKKQWGSSFCSPVSVELPTVSDSDGKVSGSEIESQILSCDHPRPECIHCTQTVQPPVIRFRILTVPFVKITEFCSWLARKIVELLRKGNIWRRETMTMNVQQYAEHPDASVLVDELAQLVTTIRCENEHTVSILSEKVTHLSEELVQVRVRSEAALATLSTELTGIREVNNILTGQLKSLHNTLDNMQSKPSLPPPPPPPPPPPLRPKTPTTPRSSRSVRTPNRKCSTPLQQSRPSITVEDLLKVTLKKAPRSVKENKLNASGAPRGPAVSLDMLRSVKLRSARRRSADQNSRSPRSASLSLRSRPSPSISLSPILAGKDSSLTRILRQVDANKRGSKRALSSPTNSEADLTKDSPRTFSIARHSKSHTVML